MTLLHQSGSLKIGEVVRYTITYTPSRDRVLPPPSRLFLRVRNTSSVALRAAFVHGPYALCVAAYPAWFDPNRGIQNPERYGVPEFEPMLRAAASWQCELLVPDRMPPEHHPCVAPPLESGAAPLSASWIVELSSQVIFSLSAAVGYEIVLARDETSLSLALTSPYSSSGHHHHHHHLHHHQSSASAQPPIDTVARGHVEDRQQSLGARDGRHSADQRGALSSAIYLRVEDTAALWNTPRLSGWDDEEPTRLAGRGAADAPVESVVPAPPAGPPDSPLAAPDHVSSPRLSDSDSPTLHQTRMKVHLVLLTHGLHSNLGADMLYLKESIDAAAKQARADAKARRSRKPDGKQHDAGVDEDDQDETVIVRGYSGNATRTERGIKYLGKRLARYVLTLTHPDQPYLPPRSDKSLGQSSQDQQHKGGNTSHTHNCLRKHSGSGDSLGESSKAASTATPIQSPVAGGFEESSGSRQYTVTSISFIGHSLGGLVQTYAVAYIQKHSPTFFDLIQPINFVALATPFLGISTENPIYVRFALDFGLVGRTGRDLGLAWRAQNLARSGWGALVGSLIEDTQNLRMGEAPPSTKPLLRILPTGPAHIALKKFRRRTIYSNAVNDGIVPLRTSCLLFLDWQGLEHVSKLRRSEPDPGAASRRDGSVCSSDHPSKPSSPSLAATQTEVPQPPDDATAEDDRETLRAISSRQEPRPQPTEDETSVVKSTGRTMEPFNPFSGIFSLIRGIDTPKWTTAWYDKPHKIPRRGQILVEPFIAPPNSMPSSTFLPADVGAGGGEEPIKSPEAPPKTSLIASARDLLNPRLPEIDFFIDPSKRPRTIFHDRVYQPTDIPPPPLKVKRPHTLRRRVTSKRHSISSVATSSTTSDVFGGVRRDDSHMSSLDYDGTINTGPSPADRPADSVVDGSAMSAEEKIARAYHRDLAWRKVLVQLESDAHNNLVVRRMFVNAFGWPVVRHLVDNHFADTAPDTDPHPTYIERLDAGAVVAAEGPGDLAALEPTVSVVREAQDQVTDLVAPSSRLLPSRRNRQSVAVEGFVETWLAAGQDHSDDEESEDEVGSAASWSPRRNRDDHAAAGKGRSPEVAIRGDSQGATEGADPAPAPAPTPESEVSDPPRPRSGWYESLTRSQQSGWNKILSFDGTWGGSRKTRP